MSEKQTVFLADLRERMLALPKWKWSFLGGEAEFHLNPATCLDRSLMEDDLPRITEYEANEIGAVMEHLMQDHDVGIALKVCWTKRTTHLVYVIVIEE